MVLCADMSRLCRSLSDLLDTVTIISKDNDKKIFFIKENIWSDVSDPYKKAFFQMLGVLAQLERDIIVQRMQEGRDFALNNGVKFGRKEKKLPKETIISAYKMGVPMSKLAQDNKVSFETIKRRLKSWGIYEKTCQNKIIKLPIPPPIEWVVSLG